jgi:carbon-monoxide dehydrogenase medium subunit
VKPARLAYARPQTLAEALVLLATHGSDASILAGGQSLIPMLNLRMSQPVILVDINSIPDLALITMRDGQLAIGGRARHNEVMHSALLPSSNSLLKRALPYVAHAAIRNRGTLGGSLALSDPAAELPACATCLDARIVAVSMRGERVIPASDFFQGLYTTALEQDELIHRVEFPLLDTNWHVEFDEVARRRGDFAIAGLALAVKLDSRRIAECRIVFAGVEAFPRRIAPVEAALTGSLLTDLSARAEAFEILAQTLDPLEEGEYPSVYRRHLARVLLNRLLTRICEREQA